MKPQSRLQQRSHALSRPLQLYIATHFPIERREVSGWLERMEFSGDNRKAKFPATLELFARACAIARPGFPAQPRHGFYFP
jgi:hypothetical protein